MSSEIIPSNKVSEILNINSFKNIFEYNGFLSLKMIVKIWRVLAQILFFHNNSSEIIKPFFENLKNENINDDKYFPSLQTFSKYQLKALYENGIITEDKFKLLIPKDQKRNQSSTKETNDMSTKIEEIISGDKIKELEKLLQENDIKKCMTITTSFLEVEEMQIPLIQYCIMKNAIKCFKYLLINGFDDPSRNMEEQIPKRKNWRHKKVEIKRYVWDCMTTAIFFGNNEFVRILEFRGIEKGQNAAHVEAAILSYKNKLAKEIFENLNKKEEKENILNVCLMASAKNNNIEGVEYLMTKGAKVNAIDIIYLNIKIVFFIKII